MNSNQKSFLSMLKCIRKLTESYIRLNICIQDRTTLLLAVIHLLTRLQLQLSLYQVLSIESSLSSTLWSQNLMLKSHYCFQKKNLWISVRLRLLLKNWASKFLTLKKSARNSIYASTASFNILTLTSETALIRTRRRLIFMSQKCMTILQALMTVLFSLWKMSSLCAKSCMRIFFLFNNQCSASCFFIFFSISLQVQCILCSSSVWDWWCFSWQSYDSLIYHTTSSTKN